MNILISGATGFIGKALAGNLLGRKHKVYAIVRPTTKKEDLDRRITTYEFDGDIAGLTSFMKEKKFDGVVHLASMFLAQHRPEDIEGLIQTNVGFGAALLEASVKSDTPWFINTGTFWQHYEDREYSPINLYAATKQAFEDIARYYEETSPIAFVTIKLCDTFGPADTRPKIFNLWSKISKTGETLGMSPGEQIIDMSYIENVIDGYMRLIALLSSGSPSQKNRLKGRSFAIHSDRRMTLRKLAKLFEKVTGKKLNIEWGGRPYRPREAMIAWTGGARIPGWKPKVSLEEGIRKTLKSHS
jgi:CDP-paratose synthetase